MLGIVLPIGNVFSQKVSLDPIPLKVVSQVFSPDEYYISKVIDERKDLNPTAFLVPDVASGSNLLTVNLEGGTIAALEQYILGAYPSSKNLRAVVIKIKDVKIIENLKDARNGLVEGDIHLDFTFALERDGELFDLLGFQGGISYQRGVRQFHLLEPYLRRSVNLAMEYFDDWIEKDASNNNLLAQSVRLKMRDYARLSESDTVFYSTARPLTWKDFTGRPSFNKYAASIFASIGYESSSSVENGVLIVDLVFKTYMLKSSSWVRSSNSSYGLNHEQRHFDIAKIIIERLKNTLQNMDLDPSNYERKISFHYLEAFREMNRMQEAYDGQTSHGTNASAQERWNKKIDTELHELGVD
ncbi:hypothetical protein CQA01_44690 [Cyclobacterium qasimii]|uniref:Uncharacterized protein n=1 Tax=Cyclobacterium qasimii TaxID=1350429 RepID=A0A512CIB3_9BACT|nr:hypothetical protein CQA01_44690 [Cyclobacterium qasimii]